MKNETSDAGEVRCKACGITVNDANAGKSECPNTNNYEHDFPGYRLVTMLTRPNVVPGESS